MTPADLIRRLRQSLAPSTRPFAPWLPRLVARVDYGLALPLLARLPRGLSLPLARLRGRVNWWFDFDWRTLSLGHRYVKMATLQGMEAVGQLRSPPADARQVELLARQRYACAAREEVDSWRLPRLDFGRLHCEIIGLEHLQQARRDGQGVVLAKAHYDALYIALGILARQEGLVVNLMGTRVIFDPRIPPPIRRHYERKAQSLNQVLSPGRLAFFEDGMSFFVRALRRGEIVAMASDGTSTSPERAHPVDFLGRRLRMASGLEFLARATDSPIAFFTCRELSGQRFQIVISKPLRLEEGGLQAAYDAMQQALLQAPGAWWGADQYRDYQDAP